MNELISQLINETMVEMGALQQQYAIGSSQTPINNINNPVPAPGAITNGNISLPIQNEDDEEIENDLTNLDEEKINNIYGIIKNVFLNKSDSKRNKLITISKIFDDIKNQ